MPNNAAAKKRLRQNVVVRSRNRAVKSAVKSQMRVVNEAVAAGEIDKAEKEFVLAAKKLDKAGARGVFHPKTTSRYKSRLAQRIRKAKQA
ncbi:MAG: 30S ribosomal protein S20 [Planctomycetales bacterium]|nr:30S ribosomal protein S20 [Planctomycetales bacterium]